MSRLESFTNKHQFSPFVLFLGVVGGVLSGLGLGSVLDSKTLIGIVLIAFGLALFTPMATVLAGITVRLLRR